MLEVMNVDSFRLIFGQTPDAMIFADPNGMIRLWNDRATKIFGYTEAEALGRSLDLIVPTELREPHWRGFRKAIALGRTASESKHLITPALHKSGSTLYVELGFGIVADESGHVIGSVAVARDVTQRYLAEEAMLKMEQELHANRPGWLWA